VDVVRDALGLLSASDADHLVIGGLASRAMLSMPISEAEDVDVLVRPEDAGALLDDFARHGYATSRPDHRWIYKAAMPDVTVDLIFRAGERIELDDEHLSRARTVELGGVPMPVPAPEDLAVMKAVFDGQDRQGRWYGAIDLLGRCQIDWDYLVHRGEMVAPARVLSLLLYASEDGVEIPPGAIEQLVPAPS
jgi:Uncharacterised nucleotidyltransferase